MVKQVLASGKALIAAEVSRTLRALLEGAANYSVSSMGGAPSGVQIPSIANIPVQQHQGGCPTQGDLALGVDWALVLDVVHELIKVGMNVTSGTIFRIRITEGMYEIL